MIEWKLDVKNTLWYDAKKYQRKNKKMAEKIYLKKSRLPLTSIALILDAGSQVKRGMKIAVIISTLPIR